MEIRRCRAVNYLTFLFCRFTKAVATEKLVAAKQGPVSVQPLLLGRILEG